MTSVTRFVRVTTVDGQEREIPEADCVRIETEALDAYESDTVRAFKPGRTWLELRDGSRIELAPGTAFPPLADPLKLFD